MHTDVSVCARICMYVYIYRYSCIRYTHIITIDRGRSTLVRLSSVTNFGTNIISRTYTISCSLVHAVRTYMHVLLSSRTCQGGFRV